ncbi:hypothetical protein OSB04_020109 [Centaurea solstitialis]|uniref:SWIM-type domain-containing protein n=1 Tax=Centaurea solstitialis TaxID=347529 RepID=A0AA38WGI2_9ASTR|nr:hypothetical protein OSB04_020109 [Centaurea solstitialis]
MEVPCNMDESVLDTAVEVHSIDVFDTLDDVQHEDEEEMHVDLDDVQHDDDDELNYLMEQSPGGSKRYFRIVDDLCKPKVGDHFVTIEAAEKHYRKYAMLGGFDVRIHNKKENKIGKITAQHYVCSKQGNSPSKTYDSLDAKPGERRRRNSNIKKCGCFACIKIHYVKERCCYESYFFKCIYGFRFLIMLYRYAIVCVPFVAIDNHKRSVVVGAALMHGEKIPDYTWVLRVFLKFHGTAPTFVITDQCPLMKHAILIVFPNIVHRLCMWHITKKVKSKIGVRMTQETNFVRDFNKIVWNVHMEPDDFETRWLELMESYKLSNDSWFKELFNIRKSWIPAFFKDMPMSGLMRTTSRSESMNAFFNSFDMAIELQRNTHCEDEVKTKATEPRMVSLRKLEAHAAQVYTRNIFFEVQKDFSKVVQDKEDGTITCSCAFYVRNGFLCRHALKERVMGNGFVYVERIFGRIRNEQTLLDKFVEQLRVWDEELESQLPFKSAVERTKDDIEELLGVSDPDDVNFVGPAGIRNKGCGKGKRLKGVYEEEAKKPMQKCRVCKKKTHHDSRNCPNNRS